MTLLREGRVLCSEQSDFMLMSEVDVIERFMRVAESKIGASKGRRALELIERLDQLTDIDELITCLSL